MKKKNKGWIKGIETFLIFFSLVLLVFSVYKFSGAWHNLDLIHNINFIVTTINSAGFINPQNQTLYIPLDKLTDTASDYVERPLNDYYITSNNDLTKYFYLGMLSALMLGWLLGKRL